MPATQRQAPIDRGALLERVDNDWAMVEILLNLLDEQGPLLEAALRRAVDGGSLDEISRAAHSMASTYGTLAAMPAFHAAKTLERIAREGDSPGVAGAIAVLETEISALRPALTELADECRRRSGEGR